NYYCCSYRSGSTFDWVF
nr:immunoglobulin light chain junction region [Macaca mulatta]MOX78287.1 immunoglobulin light chain junction region [Macaca mulatta]MOX79008.1 immunoglobulin light chain junction region [Macaca mulatta]MOX79125.1 immunoglobulin light chain junction region [Macaca mulatta]MOX81531.1 immunoglobulin light chain junction region [Macaca mulatta]